MTYEIKTAAKIYPVTIAEVFQHMRLDQDAFNEEIEQLMGLIGAATDYTQRYLNRTLITMTWYLYLDGFPQSPFKLGYSPLQSVTSIKYYDTIGAVYTLPITTYQVDVSTNDPGRIGLQYGMVWPQLPLQPMNGVLIEFIAGYGLLTTDVPEPIRRAILILIAHLYEQREMIITTGAQPKEVPLSYSALLAPWRVFPV